MSENELMSRSALAPVLALALMLTGLAAPAGAQVCEDTSALRAGSVSGEISGAHAYSVPVNGDWRFELQPQPHGWVIAVIDADGQDRTALTPPLHLDTNPRRLSGWHLRNAANTAANQGDINAPQLERRFVIAGDDGNPSPGVFNIRDYGLADLEPGERARLVYLRFDACLYFPRTEEEQQAAADLASPVFLPEEVEQLRDCGLTSDYELEAWMLPRTLGGDFDGDGALDIAAPVRRTRDQSRAIAICRAGSWIDVLEAIDADGPDEFGAYLQQAEAWQITALDTGSEAERPGIMPGVHGDVISVERIEKQAWTVFWDGTQFRAFERYHHVEP
ncbi:hypothetical protein [Maricaulis sp.]|uniref:hypothetical protein n=1 Tax=Maricaulis sp. TaxID=1486257 RepID=UPI003A8D6AE6